jgi:hypothetical protein
MTAVRLNSIDMAASLSFRSSVPTQTGESSPVLFRGDVRRRAQPNEP